MKHQKDKDFKSVFDSLYDNLPKKITKLCPLCEEGIAERLSEFSKIEYKGQTSSLPTYYWKCYNCTSDFVEVGENEGLLETITEWKKKIDLEIKD